MKANIIPIGNSQGIRIPKVLLEQTRLGKEVELEVVDQKIVIHPITHPRQGWDQKFKHLTDDNGDQLILGDALIENQFDQDEWEW
jgi:antitoxin MazE